jgi:hypothetical protein
VTGVEYFFWLAAQAFQVPVLFPPATLLILVGGVGAVGSLPYASSARSRQVLVAVLVPMALPAAILLCGVLLSHDTELDTVAPRWPERLIGSLFFAHIPVAALLVWRLRGARWLALFASIGMAGYSCGAAFMSIMSVSGRWL